MEKNQGLIVGNCDTFGVSINVVLIKKHIEESEVNCILCKLPPPGGACQLVTFNSLAIIKSICVDKARSFFPPPVAV